MVATKIYNSYAGGTRPYGDIKEDVSILALGESEVLKEQCWSDKRREVMIKE